jgi:type I restriction enzyme M protein
LPQLEQIEANDGSLTPGRYVGVAPGEVDEDFDFEEALIKRNFEELGI